MHIFAEVTTPIVTTSQSLTDSSHMSRRYIPLIAEVEISQQKDSNGATFIFERSTQVDLVLAVILLYTTKDPKIVQDLAHLGKYEKLKNREQVTDKYNVTSDK